MTAIAEETMKLVETLPSDKAQALLEFARYLVERADEEEWERKFNDPKYRPKFNAFLEEAEREIREGKTEPLERVLKLAPTTRKEASRQRRKPKTGALHRPLAYARD